MALPNTGPLSLSMIQGEFGGSNPISLSEYYAGGLFVPAGTTGINGPVPSSGSISFSHFLGTSKPRLSLSLSSASAGFTFTNSPPSLTPSTRELTSDTITGTASHGTTPYTFAWSRVSGSTAITATNPTSNISTFTATVSVDTFVEAVFRLTVTDAQGAQATADVTVILTYHSGF